MKIQDSLKSDKNNVGYLTWRPLDVLHHVSLNFFRMRIVSYTSFRENQNTYFVIHDNFVPKIVPYKRLRDNMAHAPSMLDN